MALGLPAFIGMALAQMALGAAGGHARREIQKEKEGREALRAILQKAVTDDVLGGVAPQEEVLVQAYGAKLGRQMKPQLDEYAAAMKAARERRLAMVEGAMGPQQAWSPPPGPGQSTQPVAGAPQGQPAGNGAGGGMAALGGAGQDIGSRILAALSGQPPQGQGAPQGPQPPGDGAFAALAPAPPGISLAPPSAPPSAQLAPAAPPGAPVAQAPGALAPQPSAVPQPSGPAGLMTPPSPGVSVSAPPRAVGPEPIPVQEPVMPAPPDQAREIATLGHGVQPVGGANVSVTEGGVSISRSVEQQRVQARSTIIANAWATNASPSSVLQAWARHGAGFDKDAFKAYADPHASRTIDAMVDGARDAARAAGHGFLPRTPDMYRNAARSYAALHGHVPDEAVTKAFSTKDDMNSWFLRAMAAHPNMNVAQMIATAHRVGISPDDAAFKQAVLEKRTRLEAQLLDVGMNPQAARYRANPAARYAAIRDRLGAEALTPDERKQADAFAPIGSPAQEQMLRENQVPPLMADIGAPPVEGGPAAGTKPGETPAMAAHRRSQEEAAKHAGRVAESTALGATRAKEQEPIPVNELHQFVEPNHLDTPKVGTKRGEMTQPGTKYQKFLGTKDDLSAIVRLRRTRDVYHSSVEGLKPLLERGQLENFMAKAGITGAQIHIPKLGVFHMRWNVPQGLMSDERTIEHLHKEFPEYSKPQVKEMLRHMVTLQAASDETLSILRTPLYGEKGNIRGDIVEAGIRALPSLSGNYLSEATKADKYDKDLDAFERTYGLHATERPNLDAKILVPVVGPNGEQGDWPLRRGPIPNGWKRE